MSGGNSFEAMDLAGVDGRIEAVDGRMEEVADAVEDSDDVVVVASFSVIDPSFSTAAAATDEAIAPAEVEDMDSIRPSVDLIPEQHQSSRSSSDRQISQYERQSAENLSIHHQLTATPRSASATAAAAAAAAAAYSNRTDNAFFGESMVLGTASTSAQMPKNDVSEPTMTPNQPQQAPPHPPHPPHQAQAYIPYSLGDESRVKSGTYIVGGPRRAMFDRVFFDDDRVLFNLLANEEHYMPKPLYFRNLQSEIQPFMRKMVVDWMLEVCDEQRCADDVFALAVNYFDRFLSLDDPSVAKNQLQLLGAVSMFIASKLKESSPGLSGEKLVIYTDKSISLKQLFDWELLLLSKLRWDMAAITPLDFLDQLLWRMSFPLTFDVARVREIALCVILLTYTDYKFSHYPPSMIAATCIAFAVTYLRESDESRLHLPHSASLALSPQNFQRDEQFRDATFPYHIQWCFADSRFPSMMAEESLIEQLQTITAIDADCLRQCHENIAQLVHSSCGQATLSTIKGGVAGFSASPAPSPAPTPTDVVDVSRLIENPVA